LRPASADLNLTLGMALVFTVFWLYWSFQELGVGGFFSHIFGPKGDIKGFLKYPLILIFFFVGIIEVVSILFRPVSLSLRLFGNIYAGENLMHTMSTLGVTMGLPAPVATVMSILVPVPFYFLELLVGIVQALVFTLLCAVYVKLTTSHGDEDGHHAAHDKPAPH
jgi:F-type H+-transporting ATPase subunit a